jgi:hypothetical protein
MGPPPFFALSRSNFLNSVFIESASAVAARATVVFSFVCPKRLRPCSDQFCPLLV